MWSLYSFVFILNKKTFYCLKYAINWRILFLYLFLGNGFVGTISQFNLVSKSTYDANRNLFASCNSEQIPSDLVDWNEFAYSSLINSYINVPSRCDGEFITWCLNEWPLIYFLPVRVSCYFDLSFTIVVLSCHLAFLFLTSKEHYIFVYI